jgi:hypothetical protein
MAYSELIKNFSKIRAYMRSFYVFGFRHRGEYGEKSARGYDDERRRVESWLGEYMTFRQDSSGRRFFLSVDSRVIAHNPLYRAFRTKSFTDRDIMLHFQLMDILAVSGALPIFSIMEELTNRLNSFEDGDFPDESTVRRKLVECEKLGLVKRERHGREIWFRRTEDCVELESWREALDFFSETAPLGVIGDFCRDKLEIKPSFFRFKHHYILNALDSEIVLDLLDAIGQNRETLLTMGKRKITVSPLKLYISVQTGRQYVLAWSIWNQSFAFFRIDSIDNVKLGDVTQLPEDTEEQLKNFMAHVWGVSRGNGTTLYKMEMTIWANADEAHIPLRLEREKRCGSVEQLDDTHWRYTACVYDAMEMLPWVRSFIGRIQELKCDDPRVTERFYSDLSVMASLYGGDEDAVQ